MTKRLAFCGLIQKFASFNCQTQQARDNVPGNENLVQSDFN